MNVFSKWKQGCIFKVKAWMYFQSESKDVFSKWKQGCIFKLKARMYFQSESKDVFYLNLPCKDGFTTLSDHAWIR